MSKDPIPQNHEAGSRTFSRAGTIAQKLGISKKTLCRWAEAHPDKISRFKVSDRTVLFDEKQVEAFIEASRVGKAA